MPDGARVLDVGCATGYLAAELARRGCRVTGVEADPVVAERARAHCEAVVVGDIEDDVSAASSRRSRRSMSVLCGDVLEHLRDPWSALRALAGLAVPGGRVALSVPNVAHWTGRRAMARGRFEYAEHGLFDRTHCASSRVRAPVTSRSEPGCGCWRSASRPHRCRCRRVFRRYGRSSGPR